MIRILAFASVAILAALFLPFPVAAVVVPIALAVLFIDQPLARLLGTIIGVTLGLGSLAFAADVAAPAAASTVVIPWGDWLGGLLTGAAALFVALLTRLVALAPAVIRTFLTNDVITKAVDYAIATTSGAVRGQAASIPVSNQLIGAALEWVVSNEPKIAKWADDRLRPLIAARLAALNVIPPEATSSSLAVASPGAGAA